MTERMCFGSHQIIMCYYILVALSQKNTVAFYAKSVSALNGKGAGREWGWEM